MKTSYEDAKLNSETISFTRRPLAAAIVKTGRALFHYPLLPALSLVVMAGMATTAQANSINTDESCTGSTLTDSALMDHEGTLLNTSQATNGNGTSPLSSDCNAAEGVSEATDEDTAAISGYSAAISTRQLRATGAQAIEMGDGSEASGGKSIAIGVDSAASGDRSVALGDSSTSSATRAVSLGSSVTASAENSVVIGTDSSIATNAINATAIGYSNSVSDQSKYTSVLGMKNTIDGNAVRVLGNNNEINAAYAGISGSNNTVSSVSSHANVVGNNAAVDGLEAIVVGNFGVASADHTIVLGAEGASTAEEAIAIGHGASASEASSVALGSNSVTDAAVATPGITLAGTDYTFAGSSPIATVGIGSAGQERTLTHLAAGRVSASSTDAINGSQLYATNQAVEGISSRVDDLEGQYASLSDDALTYDAGSDKGSLTLGGQNGTSITNLADGDISSGSTDAVTGGQLWDLSQQLSGAGGGGGLYSNISSSGPGAQIDAADGIAMGGGARVEEGAEGGIALGSGSVADRGGMNGAREAFSDVAVGSTAGALSVGSAGGERQITNVAGGTEATDAVNVRQLESVQAGAVNYDRQEDGSVDYGSVTLGDAAAGPTTVHNVGPGVADTDAANVGQLNALNQNVQRQFSRLADKIGDVEDEANAGSATAIAMASVPQAYLPGRSMIAVGGGNYSGESAAAVGVSHLTENGKWAFKLNGSGDSQGNMGVGVGAGFHW